MDQANRFLDNMTSYGLGKVVDEMADLQKDIIEAVRETGNMGQLNLVLKFKRSGERGVIVESQVVSKIPKHPIKPVEMFVDDDNLLHDHNPDQLTHENVQEVDFSNNNVNEA